MVGRRVCYFRSTSGSDQNSAAVAVMMLII